MTNTPVRDFLKLLRDLTGSNIILAQQEGKRPVGDFFTLQILNTSFPNISNDEYLGDEDEVLTVRTKPVQIMLQIDCFSSDVLSARSNSDDFITDIKNKYQQQILDEGFGIVSISGIKNTTELENSTDYKFRNTFEIEFTATTQTEWSIENMNKVIMDDETATEVIAIERGVI